MDGDATAAGRRRATENDRTMPANQNAVLDALVRYGLIHYEDALDLRDRDPVASASV